MKPANEALLQKNARLSDDEIRVALQLADEVDKAIDNNMTFSGLNCYFKTHLPDNVRSAIGLMADEAGWIYQWQPDVKPGRVHGGASFVAGWALSLAPKVQAYKDADVKVSAAALME